MYRFNPRLVQSFIYSRHSIYSNYNVICRDAFDLGRSRQYYYLSLKSKGEVQYRSGLRSKVCTHKKTQEGSSCKTRGSECDQEGNNQHPKGHNILHNIYTIGMIILYACNAN